MTQDEIHKKGQTEMFTNKNPKVVNPGFKYT